MQLDAKKYIKRYFQEILDTFIAVLLISYINPKVPFKYDNVAINTLMIGTIIFFLGLYNPELKSPCKNAIYYGIGNSWFDK